MKRSALLAALVLAVPALAAVPGGQRADVLAKIDSVQRQIDDAQAELAASRELLAEIQAQPSSAENDEAAQAVKEAIAANEVTLRTHRATLDSLHKKLAALDRPDVAPALADLQTKKGAPPLPLDHPAVAGNLNAEELWKAERDRLEAERREKEDAWRPDILKRADKAAAAWLAEKAKNIPPGLVPFVIAVAPYADSAAKAFNLSGKVMDATDTKQDWKALGKSMATGTLENAGGNFVEVAGQAYKASNMAEVATGSYDFYQQATALGEFGQAVANAENNDESR